MKIDVTEIIILKKCELVFPMWLSSLFSSWHFSGQMKCWGSLLWFPPPCSVRWLSMFSAPLSQNLSFLLPFPRLWATWGWWDQSFLYSKSVSGMHLNRLTNNYYVNEGVSEWVSEWKNNKKKGKQNKIKCFFWPK